MSDWVEVGSPPDEPSVSLIERMSREAGIPAPVLEPGLSETRQRPDDMTGSW